MRRLAVVLVACLFVTTGSTPVVESAPEGPPPVHVCESLKPELIDDRTYRFVLRYRAENGARPDAVWYQYGDGGMDFKDSVADQTHRYRESGTYEVEATIFFSVYDDRGKVLYGKAESCPITIATVE